MSRVLPILFNIEMVRAILDGRKTVTRRVLKLPKYIKLQDDGLYTLFTEGTCYENQHLEDIVMYLNKPCQPGDILYVRETWGISNMDYDDKAVYIVYKADDETKNCRRISLPNDKFERLYDSMSESEPDWHPSIHMPKEAARIFLKVKDVRVERLQEMNEVDTAKEGIRTDIQTHSLEDPDFIENFGGIDIFKDLWNSTIKKSDLALYGFDANPWVWVIEFERCEKPENF